MNIRKEVAKSIMMSLDPLIISKLAADMSEHPVIQARIRRALEKARLNPDVQEALRDFVEKYSKATNRELNQ